MGSNRDREISMSVGLGRSKLDSKGGVVGGNIDVNPLEMVCKYRAGKPSRFGRVVKLPIIFKSGV